MRPLLIPYSKWDRQASPPRSEERLQVQAISPPTPALFLQVVSRGVGSIYQTTDRMPAPGAHLCPTGALHTRHPKPCAFACTRRPADRSLRHRKLPLPSRASSASPAASRPSKPGKNLLGLFFFFLFPFLMSSLLYSLFSFWGLYKVIFPASTRLTP